MGANPTRAIVSPPARVTASLAMEATTRALTITLPPMAKEALVQAMATPSQQEDMTPSPLPKEATISLVSPTALAATTAVASLLRVDTTSSPPTLAMGNSNSQLHPLQAMGTAPSPQVMDSSKAGAAMVARVEAAMGALEHRVVVMGVAVASRRPLNTGGLLIARHPTTTHPHLRTTVSRTSMARVEDMGRTLLPL